MSKRTVERKKNKAKIAIFSILAAGIIGGVSYMVYTGTGITDIVKVIQGGNRTISDIENEGGVYITETAFNGSSTVEPLLFSYPFRYSTENYTSNKQYVADYGLESAGLIADRSQQIMQQYWTFDYRTVASDYENELSRRVNLVVDDLWMPEFGDDYTIDTEEMVATMLKTFSDAKLQIMATYEVSPFLVFKESHMTVNRGILNIKVYNIAENANLADWFPCKLEKGKTYRFVFDTLLIGEMDTTDETDCRTRGWNFVDNVSENASEVVNNYLTKDYLYQTQEEFENLPKSEEETK